MSRHRLLCMSVMLALVAAMPAGAAPTKPRSKKHERVVTYSYDHPCAVGTDANTAAGYCPTLTTGRDEKFASMQVVDQTGLPVPVVIAWADQRRLVCGSSAKFAVAAEQTLEVGPMIAVGNTGCPTPATSGVIKVTFSNS